MHRSGTSAVAGLLHMLGVDLGRNLMKPGNDNPKGFFEHYEIVGAHVSMLEALGSYMDDILPLPDGWEKEAAARAHHDYLKRLILSEFSGKPIWGFKDPRTARLLPLWHPLFEEVGSSPRFILMVRHPDEIAVSMTSRGGHSYNQTLLVTLDHLLSAERHTRGRPRIVISYDNVLADWRREMNRIECALGISRWPVAMDSIARQAGEFVDPGLRHHFGRTAGSAESAVGIRGANPQIAHWAFRGYQIFQEAANNGAPINEGAVEKLAAELRAAMPYLAAWRPLRVRKDDYAKLYVAASRLGEEVKRLARENEELRSRLPK
jgi:hypothetical protein